LQIIILHMHPFVFNQVRLVAIPHIYFLRPKGA
jgi:hypothetical protein